MFSFNTNAESILGKELMRIQQLEASTPLLLTDAARDTRELIADRIQNQGLNSSGQQMQTRAQRSIGKYSVRHGKARAQRGLNTNVVDWTFDGTLFSSQGWSVLNPGSNKPGVGFAQNEQARKAAELEDYFGDAFTMTPQEAGKVDANFFSVVKQIMS